MSCKEPFISFGICGLKMRGLIIIWGIFVEEQLEIPVTVFCTMLLPSNPARKGSERTWKVFHLVDGSYKRLDHCLKLKVLVNITFPVRKTPVHLNAPFNVTESRHLTFLESFRDGIWARKRHLRHLVSEGHDRYSGAVPRRLVVLRVQYSVLCTSGNLETHMEIERVSFHDAALRADKRTTWVGAKSDELVWIITVLY